MLLCLGPKKRGPLFRELPIWELFGLQPPGILKMESSSLSCQQVGSTLSVVAE